VNGICPSNRGGSRFGHPQIADFALLHQLPLIVSSIGTVDQPDADSKVNHIHAQALQRSITGLMHIVWFAAYT